MDRSVAAELLDQLPAEDADALGSRRDLQRLNAWMGNPGRVARLLRRALPGTRPGSVAELGAGDGRFIWRVAQLLGPGWRGTRLLLLDLKPAVSPEAIRGIGELGWQVESVQADAADWLSENRASEVMVANLFLHHFAADELAEMLPLVAKQTHLFIAVEPRRSSLALLFSRLVWLVGCNRVTQHDAPVSVRAGFAGQELSRFWPAGGGWKIEERPAGLFGHVFVAQRNS